MALGWIKVRTDLQTHPKVVRISSALRADRFRVIGGLHAVWSIFDAHSLDGTLDGYTTETLDALIGWPGFSAAMAAVEWLEVSEDSLEVPRFDEHNGANAKRRAEDAVRKRLARASASGPQEVREMSAKKPDIARTESGPEKRREEKNSSPNGEGESARKRAPACPDEVEPQTWSDWLSLRKAKKAPVTVTVIDQAAKEAAKAGLSLDAFLRIWCARGSQGLQADWLKPAEVAQYRGNVAPVETAYQRSMRLKVAEFAPDLARPDPGASRGLFDAPRAIADSHVIDVEGVLR